MGRESARHGFQSDQRALSSVAADTRVKAGTRQVSQRNEPRMGGNSGTTTWTHCAVVLAVRWQPQGRRLSYREAYGLTGLGRLRSRPCRRSSGSCCARNADRAVGQTLRTGCECLHGSLARSLPNRPSPRILGVPRPLFAGRRLLSVDRVRTEIRPGCDRVGEIDTGEDDQWLRARGFDVKGGRNAPGTPSEHGPWTMRSFSKPERRSSSSSAQQSIVGRRLSERHVAQCTDLSHWRTINRTLPSISLFDDTSNVWRDEDFALVERVSRVATWSRPDES